MGRKKRCAGRNLPKNDHGQRTRGSGKISAYSRDNKKATKDDYGQALLGQDDVIAGKTVKLPPRAEPVRS